MLLEEAPFALILTADNGALLYRRRLGDHGKKEKLYLEKRMNPLAMMAGMPLLRAAVQAQAPGLEPQAGGGAYPLGADWGARVACYAYVAVGMSHAGRLHRAAENLRQADGAEAAWWFGLCRNGRRAVRALRILVEAVP